MVHDPVAWTTCSLVFSILAVWRWEDLNWSSAGFPKWYHYEFHRGVVQAVQPYCRYGRVLIELTTCSRSGSKACIIAMVVHEMECEQERLVIRTQMATTGVERENGVIISFGPQSQRGRAGSIEKMRVSSHKIKSRNLRVSELLNETCFPGMISEERKKELELKVKMKIIDVSTVWEKDTSSGWVYVRRHR